MRTFQFSRRPITISQGEVSDFAFARSLKYALKAGQPSDFALRLTDLDEVTPVAKAEGALNVRSKSNQAATTFKAQASEKTGVFTSQVVLPKASEYYTATK